MSQLQPLHVDIDAVLRQRVPKYYRYIPGFLIHWLERTIHQDEINAIAQHVGDKTGVEAADIALQDLETKVVLVGKENIPAEGRFIFASNHPLGGLDGLALISAIGNHYQGNIRFLVNDLLMALVPLRPIFLPVNKYGRQSRERAKEIEAQYQGDNQMITFPAGLCSRMGKGGVIHDLEWQKFFVSEAVRTQRDIIPIFFDAVNSRSFYRKAHWRKKLGIKFNFEMLWLPDEMFKSKGSTFKAYIGKPISWQSLDAKNAKSEAARICDLVYRLKQE